MDFFIAMRRTMFVGLTFLCWFFAGNSTVDAFQVAHYRTMGSPVSLRTPIPNTAMRHEWHSSSNTCLQLTEAGTDNEKSQATTSFVTRMRKFIRALYKILTAPLRMLRTPTKKTDEVAPAGETTNDLVEVEATTPEIVEEAPQIVESESTDVLTPEIDDTTEEVNRKPMTAAAPVASDQSVMKGIRSAKASVDLSGDWVMIDSEEFKKQYDEYLRRLGQPMIVRSIALGIIGLTTECTVQKDQGKELYIRGTNVRGVWERSLISSTAEEPLDVAVVTADLEEVKAESWWEDNGKVHRSWMKGVSNYGGGDFESRRYLEQGGKVLVCESVFHPKDETRGKAEVTWKFLRKGETL